MKRRSLLIIVLLLGFFDHAKALKPVEKEFPKRISIIAIAESVLEVADAQFKSDQFHKALDSYAWVLDNLPNAPISDELMQDTYEMFVKTLNLSHPDVVIEFGIERARKYALEFPRRRLCPSHDDGDLKRIRERLDKLEASAKSKG